MIDSTNAALLIGCASALGPSVRLALEEVGRRTWTVDSVPSFATGLARLRTEDVGFVLVDPSVDDTPEAWPALVRSTAPTAVVIALLTDHMALSHAVTTELIDGYLGTDAPSPGMVRQSIRFAFDHRQTLAHLEQRLHNLAPSEACLRHLIERNTDAMFVIDRRGVILFANQSAETLFNQSARQLAGQMFGYPLVPHDPTEIDVVHDDGEAVVAELHVADTVWRGRRALVASFRNITNRVRAVEARQKSEALTATLLDAVADGVLGVDIRGNISFANVACCQLLQSTPDALVGTPHDVILRAPSSEHTGEPTAVLQSLADGQVRRTRNDLWRPSGSSFPAEYTVAPIHDDKSIIGAVVRFADITQQQLLETQLLHAKKFEGIGLLAAGIAHEINTPSQYVSHNLVFLRKSFNEITDLLQSSRDTVVEALRNGREGELLATLAASLEKMDLDFLLEEIPHATDQSLEGMERINTIVRSIKEFSHPGSREFEPADLNRAIESTIAICRCEWHVIADLETDLDRSIPLVPCRLQEINQVLLNIVVNAAHAIESMEADHRSHRGRIRVSTKTAGDMAEVRIEDNGPGIPAEIRERIFEPFFTTKKVGRGTGQGLAIARSIVVEKHAGQLDIESAVGVGTAFIIRLPVVASGRCDTGPLSDDELPAVQSHGTAKAPRRAPR